MKKAFAILMILALLSTLAAAFAEALPWDTPIIVDDGVSDKLTLRLSCVEDDATAEGIEKAGGRWVRVELSATGRTMDMGELQQLCEFSMMIPDKPQHVTMTVRQNGGDVEYLISLWFDKSRSIELDNMTVDVFNWGKDWQTVELSLAGAPGPEK